MAASILLSWIFGAEMVDRYTPVDRRTQSPSLSASLYPCRFSSIRGYSKQWATSLLAERGSSQIVRWDSNPRTSCLPDMIGVFLVVHDEPLQSALPGMF